MTSSTVNYLPFQSFAEPSFWLTLGEHKLNNIKLSEDLIPLQASYTLQSIIKRRSTDHDASSSAAVVANELVPGRMRLDQGSVVGASSTPAPSSSRTGEIHHEIEDLGIAESADAAMESPTSTRQSVSRNDQVMTKGSVKILNTIESYKHINKNELLNESCLPSLLRACGLNAEVSGGNGNDGENSNAENLEALSSFFCLCHVDLKNHKVLYWFVFPVLAPAPGKAVQYAKPELGSELSTSKPQTALQEAWGRDRIRDFHRAVHDLRIDMLSRRMTHPAYFIVVESTSQNSGDVPSFRCLELSSKNYCNLTEEEQHMCYFAFLDPIITYCPQSAGTSAGARCQDTGPVGWPLRNLIAYMTLKLGIKNNVQVISYRPSVIRRFSHESVFNPEEDTLNDASLLLHIQLPRKEDYLWPSKNPTSISASDPAGRFTCMGWELNARSKPGPRSINLAPLLSPAHLAQQATDLNLKLMKWRMIPNLDLHYLSQMRVLLLGAGTLGCSVARTLLGWGVRRFTFVDNGKVSYSNPVRQTLFEIQDCEGGGRDKAIAAAEALKRIAGPTIQSEGYVLSIPMPGHAFNAKEEPNVQRDTEKIQDLVDEADVVFLLTDTRESRWLPTVMARKSNKMMINAALGLDSWLVMRHGGNRGDRLGCYFCNDVVAPENSTNNRTLDQQCTVTRPGLAPLASSMAVELCISLLHHNDKQDAPAPSPSATKSSFSLTVPPSKSTSPLGMMPHQIRGSLVSYTMMTPTVPAFEYCTGCCDAVVNQYRKSGFEFVKKVCCNPDGSYLEDLAGLTAFRAKANSMMADCLDWEEEDVEET